RCAVRWRAAATAATASSRGCRRRAKRVTCAPRAATRVAIARPIPSEPPGMYTCLSAKSASFIPAARGWITRRNQRAEPLPPSARPLHRQARRRPAAPSTVHRHDVGVAHLLQVVGAEGGAEAAATVQNDLSVEVRDDTLDVAFDDALTQVT